MTLLEIYRIALAEGLTAQQAAKRFGVKYQSVAKVKTKHKLPSLKNEWDSAVEEQLEKMNDSQLLSYFNALMLPKNVRCFREIRVCKQILEKRKLVPTKT